MKLRNGKKVQGIYFKQVFSGKIFEFAEGIRYNHKNNCVKVKIELEDAITVFPGCVMRDYIFMILDADTLEMNGNKILDA